MSDLKLFRTQGDALVGLDASSVPLEKRLQTLFEKNLEALLGVRFLASEYVTTNGGRMDTLGIDENGCPVIIEYKRDRSENVINQGLFYLDWLVDHRGDFELLVLNRYGKDVAGQIEWGSPRLICIAADFTRYDVHAVKQMSRNIELIRYRRFGDDLLLLDQLTSVSSGSNAPIAAADAPGQVAHKYKTITESMEGASEALNNLYADLESFLLGLGDDVTRKTLRFYIAFRRIKNFACVEFKPSLDLLRLFLKLDPATLELEPGFTRDVSDIGHFGTGDLEVTLRSHDDLERAKPLIVQSYEAS
jgi:predicted transport protein